MLYREKGMTNGASLLDTRLASANDHHHDVYNSIITIIILVSRFGARPISASTARLSWSRPNGAIKHYIIEVTNRNTSSSEAHYIINSTKTSTDIYSLHPYHLYQFSIAVFTVIKGPSYLVKLHMPQAGMNAYKT